MKKKLSALREKRAEKVRDLEALANQEAWNEETTKKYEDVKTEIKALDVQMQAIQDVLDATATGLSVRDDADLQVGEPGAQRDPKRGYAAMAMFAQDVRAAATGNGVPERLRNATASTVGQEGAGADGGYLIPPEYSSQIMQLVEAEDDLLPMCTQQTTSSNAMTFPKDETTPWGTDGIQAFWESETATISQSKPVFKAETQRLSKLTALVPVTEELLADAPALDTYIRTTAPVKMAFKVSLAILTGAGQGEPLGILNSGALKTIAKESGQAAASIVLANVEKMWGGMLAQHRRDAVWLANQDIESQLNTMVISGSGTNPNIVPMYLPSGGLSASPYSTLKGKPMIFTQACETLGALGDLLFVNLKYYRVLRKASGMQVDTSIHLWFDQALQAFRFIWRLNGQPMLSAPVKARSGNTTYSPFVALAARG